MAPVRSLRSIRAQALGPRGLGLVVAAAALLSSPASQAQAGSVETAASKGAQVYCFMRSAGNDHDVSWTAAYALIKRQSASLFKTSPEHAAVMITEAVVQNPTTYPDCGRYLGSLFERSARPPQTDSNVSGTGTSGGSSPSSTNPTVPTRSGTARYSY